ncbi:hypothetical protein MNEG_4753 [Monoraphidium neglectum]|uniref:Uncharacterized protein n=1 Tax=Monoraphidium neglectum TaxID=145388 RepID=A0A0D2L8Q6_9CHLO|nr:hypothetical protein MNEG_4753 [Monoraphidium neglectum]KIZ03204.1 hypothetical protein MNEG_4753 [Monoraphidium neglectum]|eukprot:XP_013902223.1 hypothetical protein MNEG_4753 [Monoraphidium neglectum]
MCGAAPSAGRSPSAALVPIRYLFGIEVRDPPAGERGILYTHRATGFSFQLGPAAALAHERGAASSGEGSAWDGEVDDDDEVDEDEEEQVAFLPVELGDAAKCLPEFLKVGA